MFSGRRVAGACDNDAGVFSSVTTRMDKQFTTQRDSIEDRASRGGDVESARGPIPGVVLLFSAGQAACSVMPVSAAGLELGRGLLPEGVPADPKMSRRHASVGFDGERFCIQDHGSQNGTYVDGQRVSGRFSSATACVLRTGDSVFLLSGDTRRHRRLSVVCRGDVVMGPALQETMAQATRAAQHGRTLHITGESGSGKEGIARTFHVGSSSQAGPFVAINCATIAAGLAERLLFGARRGAYSGAVQDTEGLVQSADGGTLFLDEIAELDPAVQAKLLRVLETREVLPLGALRPRAVNVQLCSASHRNLRVEVGSGRFREDLYFRISRPSVEVPPLRRRLEEIPFFLERALRSVDPSLTAHSSLVEACLLRHWPGNVRELLAEARGAGQVALGQAVTKVDAQHLSADAGRAIERVPDAPAVCAMAMQPQAARAGHRPPPERAQVEAALAQAQGNISAAARMLGLHRTQLKRLLEKYGMAHGRHDPSLDGEDE